MEATRSGNVLVVFKNDNKQIFEYKAGKEFRVHQL